MRSGEDGVGQWITEARNVHEDYKKIYGEPPGEEAQVVSVTIDSDDTRSRAEAYMGAILFRKQ